MKIHKHLKIEAACSNDKDRLTINDPYLYRDESGDKLIATNGRIIAVVPVECHEGDSGGYVPKACLKDARKAGYVLLNESAEVGDVLRPRREACFPNWKAVIPNNSGVKTIKLAIDPEFLKDLADAMGTAAVALEIPVGNFGDGSSRVGEGCVIDPILVRPATARGREPVAPDAIGVIMPLRIT